MRYYTSQTLRWDLGRLGYWRNGKTQEDTVNLQSMYVCMYNTHSWENYYLEEQGFCFLFHTTLFIKIYLDNFETNLCDHNFAMTL